MTRYIIAKTEAIELAELKQQYLQQLAAPLDGMWQHFVAMSEHFSITVENRVVGYFVINAEKKLLQFFVAADGKPEAIDSGLIFQQILFDEKVIGAVLATCEDQFLSLCMDHQTSVLVNALMYCAEPDAEIQPPTFPATSEFRIIVKDELPTAVEFGVMTLGADPNWLQGYFGNLIAREELFGLWLNQDLIATGECRQSDIQKPYADLGMVVSTKHRGQGIATNILRALLRRCHEQGLQAICSTERQNIAAQKAISNSGFFSRHRILEIRFSETDP